MEVVDRQPQGNGLVRAGHQPVRQTRIGATGARPEFSQSSCDRARVLQAGAIARPARRGRLTFFDVSADRPSCPGECNPNRALAGIVNYPTGTSPIIHSVIAVTSCQAAT